MNNIKGALLGTVLAISNTQAFSKTTVELTQYTVNKVDKTCMVEDVSDFIWEENLSEYRYLNEEEFSKLSDYNKQICNLEVDITDTEYYFENFNLYSIDTAYDNINEEDRTYQRNPLIIEMDNFVKDFDRILLLYTQYISDLKNNLNLLVKNKETLDIKEPWEVKRIKEIFTEHTD